MKKIQIKESFLKFFKDRNHIFIPSDTLSGNSESLLFTNSGMNQFVPFFLGEKKSKIKSIVNFQKCIRAGGKHNDLEDVGFDSYHHTFFEMLGNWSFGDFFKKESINWAWELLTEYWNLPKNRLFITIYDPGLKDPFEFDSETYYIWEKIFLKEKLSPKKHIKLFGKKDNFWMMGETGPCGPCSEIHIDLSMYNQNNGGLVNQGSNYCLELWNIVFIQFNATKNGRFNILKTKFVDTGMGLERICGIIKSTKNFTNFARRTSNYNSKLFIPLLTFLKKRYGIIYRSKFPKNKNNISNIVMQDCSIRVIIDHLRSIIFAISDKILPGKNKKNYVIKRLIRRIMIFGEKLKISIICLEEVIDIIIKNIKCYFPELLLKQQIIKNILKKEAYSFQQSLKKGFDILNKKIKGMKKIFLVKNLFLLYDTYGIPQEILEIKANEYNLLFDKNSLFIYFFLKKKKNEIKL